MDEVISSTNLRPGETGIVVEFQGGMRMVARLEGLGIRVGSKIRMVSLQFMRGPVVIEFCL